jgi:hypothetical protein
MRRGFPNVFNGLHALRSFRRAFLPADRSNLKRFSRVCGASVADFLQSCSRLRINLFRINALHVLHGVGIEPALAVDASPSMPRPGRSGASIQGEQQCAFTKV